MYGNPAYRSVSELVLGVNSCPPKTYAFMNCHWFSESTSLFRDPLICWTCRKHIKLILANLRWWSRALWKNTPCGTELQPCGSRDLSHARWYMGYMGCSHPTMRNSSEVSQKDSELPLETSQDTQPQPTSQIHQTLPQPQTFGRAI